MLLHQVAHIPCQQPLPHRLVGRASHVVENLRQRRRTLQEVAVQYGRRPPHEVLEATVAFHVARGQALQFLHIALLVVPAQHIVAARKRLEAIRIHRMDSQPVLSQFQVVYHLALEHMADVRAGGHSEVREQLFGNAGSAHEVAPFQYQNPPARLRKVVGRHQPVVSRPHDNR